MPLTAMLAKIDSICKQTQPDLWNWRTGQKLKVEYLKESLKESSTETSQAEITRSKLVDNRRSYQATERKTTDRNKYKYKHAQVDIIRYYNVPSDFCATFSSVCYNDSQIVIFLSLLHFDSVCFNDISTFLGY